MADGTTKPIKDIQVGDRVETTDPATDTTGPRTVVALHFNHDTDLTDLTLQTANGNTETLHTTWHHPIWDQTQQRWVDAAQILPGDQLRTLDGTTGTVTAVHNFVGNHEMRDFTVDTVHTYYVVAAGVPVLVHNCGETTFHHGTDIDSAVELLNGSPLDAATGAARHTDGPGGFFMATHADDAAFFATRNGPGTILDVTISGNGMRALQEAGATLRPIPRGPRSPIFNGNEFHIPTGAFDVFNSLRRAGDITFRPG
jgi:hypothetical protein